MPKLEMDAVSAKTLPHLDKLYADAELDKLTEILSSTADEPLRRLTLASLSRHTHLAPADLDISSNTALLLEELIKMNLKGDGDLIPIVLDEIQPSGAEVMVLVMPLARYFTVGGTGRYL